MRSVFDRIADAIIAGHQQIVVVGANEADADYVRNRAYQCIAWYRHQEYESLAPVPVPAGVKLSVRNRAILIDQDTLTEIHFIGANRACMWVLGRSAHAIFTDHRQIPNDVWTEVTMRTRHTLADNPNIPLWAATALVKAEE